MTHLSALIAGPKRHAEFTHDGGRVDIVERTETSLGGFFADPPAMTSRAPDGGRLWSLRAVEREIAFALNRHDDPDALRPPAPWERSGEPAFPPIRRLMVTTPEIAKILPTALARPGTRYLEGIGSPLRRDIDPTAVALDPGGDLAGWPSLAWIDRATGSPVRMTTDPEDFDAVLLDTLDQRAVDWATKPPATAIESITVHEHGIRWVGAVSGVIDADLDGVSDPGARRPVYGEPDRLAIIQTEAARFRKRAFSKRTGLPPTVAERAALGRPISSRNVVRALEALGTGTVAGPTCGLESCSDPVSRSGATFCSRAHQVRAYRLRPVGHSSQPTGPSAECASCETVLVGVTVPGECPVCSAPINQTERS